MGGEIMEGYNGGAKEIERIETLVIQAKEETYSICDSFKSMMLSKIYGQATKNEVIDTPKELESNNKFDRIILDLNKIINALREFKKKELKELESELEKL